MLASRVLVRDAAVLASSQASGPAEDQALRLVGLSEISAVSATLLTGQAQFARAAGVGSAELRDRTVRLRARMTDPQTQSLLDGIVRADSEYQQAFEAALRAPPGLPVASATALVGLRGRALESSLDSLVARVYSDVTAAHG